jgi:hypothetical protein
MGAGHDFDHPEGHRDRERQTRVTFRNVYGLPYP